MMTMKGLVMTTTRLLWRGARAADVAVKMEKSTGVACGDPFVGRFL